LLGTGCPREEFRELARALRRRAFAGGFRQLGEGVIDAAKRERCRGRRRSRPGFFEQLIADTELALACLATEERDCDLDLFRR